MGFGDFSMSNNEYRTDDSSGCLPIFLCFTYAVLKLTNVITWSWWWVTSPIWIIWGFGLLALVIIVVFAAVFVFVDWIVYKIKKK